MILSATAAHVTLARLGGTIAVSDANTGNRIGTVDVIKGFAHYVGTKHSAHEGFAAVVAGGTDGIVAALAQGVRNGRDDRQA